MKSKIMIWGTGKEAAWFMNNYYDMLQDFFLLKGFIDNNIKRQGKSFVGYMVFSPKVLKKMDLDILVVMNTKGLEISKQVKKLFFSRCPFRLLTSKREFFNYLINEKKLFASKNIVFTGDYDGYAIIAGRDYYSTSSSRFLDLKDVGDFCIDDVDYFCVCGKRFSNLVVNDFFQKDIKRNLMERYNIPKNKILLENQWHWFFESDVRVRNYASDEKDKYLIIRVNDPYRGWGQILLNFMAAIDYAEKHGMHPVIDMKYSDNMYLPKEDKEGYNVWDRFFYPLSKHKIEDILKDKYCVLYGSDYYISEEYMQFSKIKFLPSVFEQLNRRKNKIFKNANRVLAVVYRGSDYEIAEGHPSPRGIDEYIVKIDVFIEKYGFDAIFLATEVIEIIDVLKRRYGEKIRYISQKRVHKNEYVFLKNIFSKGKREEIYKNSIDYLSVIYILSQCDGLCGCRCGASQLAVVMNSKKYLFVDYFS